MSEAHAQESADATAGARAQPRTETVNRFIRAVEEATGVPFEVLAERANVELESRKEAARREVLEYLGESAAVATEEAEQIRREWQE